MAEDLTAWFRQLSDGDAGSLDRIVRVLYAELHELARWRLRDERRGHTLPATALVNEAYLRLAHQNRIAAGSRTQFFAVASNTMRRALVDYVRTRARLKRGGGMERVPLEHAEALLTDEEADELLALEDALGRLAQLNPRGAQVVEHRFFPGLSVEEIAELLGVSSKTVQRDWIAARAWLRKEVARDLGLPERRAARGRCLPDDRRGRAPRPSAAISKPSTGSEWSTIMGAILREVAWPPPGNPRIAGGSAPQRSLCPPTHLSGRIAATHLEVVPPERPFAPSAPGDIVRTTRRIAVLSLLSLGLLLTLSPPTQAAEGTPETPSATTIGAAGVAEPVSAVMQRQAELEAAGRAERDVEEEIEQPDRSHLPQNPDSQPVPQLPELPPGFKPQPGEVRTLSPQTVGTNFTGATLAGINPTLSFPPDCMGVVGPTQYVVFVNGRLVTFNKATGLADGVLNADPDVFFSSVRNGSITSDPRIRYDRLTARWILVIINVSTPNRILLAVSDAASAGVVTPSTVFTFWFIPIASTPPAISSTCLADYPTLGVDANALYIGTDNFCGSPQAFNSTDGYVVRKSSVLGAGPIILTVFRGLAPTATSAGPYAPQGVDNFDPAATEGYFIGVDNATFGTLMMRRVANPGGTPTISTNISITVPATTFPNRVPHLGNTGGANGQLSALDDRLFAAHLRSGRLWTAHNIGVNNTGAASGSITRDGSRWYELSVPVGSGMPTVVQAGTVFTASATNLNDQRYYWIPSIMVSGQGHAALGFSTAGTNERANAAVVGRLLGEPAGTMETPVLFTSSATAYNPPSDPGGANGRRWGDYSYTSVDPLDDQTMWTVQMFTDATNSYGVRVAKLIAPPPAMPGSIADVNAGQNPVAVSLTGVSAAGSGFYDPGADLPGVPAFHHVSVGVSNGGATGTPPSVVSATYVAPATIALVLDAASATPNLAGEKYTVTVKNPDGQTASAAVLRVVGTAPVATIAVGPGLPEGNSGTTAFEFTVNLSSAATALVTIDYQTGDGTATVADNDYQAATTAITIPFGQATGTIIVNVNGDNKFETDESLVVTLTAATSATLGATVTASGTIQNDDSQPAISIAAAVSAAEGNSGSPPFVLPVSLSNPSASPVSAHYAVSDGTATLADNDYGAASGTVTIPAGQTSGAITVDVVGDTKHEADETFGVSLSGPSGGTLGNASANATITNDDQPPAVSIDSIALAEGDTGTQAFVFTVSLSQASGLPAAVDFATADGTALLANNDYQAESGTLSFAPGVVSQPASVLVNGDQILESDETFVVNLTNPGGALAGSLQGTGTILNDDGVPALSVGGVALPEGNAGTTPFVFPVSLSNPTDQIVTVHYQTSDSTATLANNDYQAASGTLIIPAMTSTETVTVLVNGDVCGEPQETFRLRLSVPTGAALGSGTGVGTIQNDDDATAPDVTVVSPNGGEVLDVGSTADIQWTATDGIGVTGVDVLLSRDGGVTYPELLASGIANTGSFLWTVTAPSSATADALVQVKAHDAGCNTGMDVSDAAFQIFSVVTAVPEGGPITEFALGLVRPNPTGGRAEIDFELPRDATVRLSVVDVRGREVVKLVDRTLAAGRYRSSWNGRTVGGPAARGVYFVSFEAAGRKFHRRLVLVR
jgi:RNA polymerase sigma factor (TIGR02999 family)